MLKAKICFNDFLRPPQFEKNRIIAGGSYVEVFDNKNVDYVYYYDKRELVLLAFEAITPSAKTLINKCLIDKNVNRIFEEYVGDAILLKINSERNRAQITQGYKAVAPVYFKFANNCIYIDWDFSSLCEMSAITYDELCNYKRYGLITVAAGVFQCLPNSVLELSDRGIVSEKKVNRTCYNSYVLEAADDLVNIIDDYIKVSLSQYSNYNNRLLYELSGGLDSSTLFLKRDTGIINYSVTTLLNGFEVKQTERVKAIYQSHYKEHSVFLNTGSVFLSSKMKFASPYDELYFCLTQERIKVAKAVGADAIVTGIGGDEVFKALVDNTGGWKNPSVGLDLPQSIYKAMRSCSRLFLTNGIWPIHFFARRDIFTLLMSVPPQKKANRSFQLQLINRDTNQFNFYAKEDFYGVFINSLVVNLKTVLDRLNCSNLSATQKKQFKEKIVAVSNEKSVSDDHSLVPLIKFLYK